MARPRRFVRVSDGPDGPVRVESGGREIHGLSYHGPSDRYYTIRPDGRRTYLGHDLNSALLAVGAPRTFTDVTVRLNSDGSIVNKRTIRTTKEDGFTKVEMVHGGGPLEDLRTALVDRKEVIPSKESLTDCGAFWRSWKEDEKRSSRWTTESMALFDELVKVIGDKPVNRITKSDISAYDRNLARNGRSNAWRSKRIKTVRTILTFCLRKSDIPLPESLALWLSSLTAPTVAPAKTHRLPFPPDLFRSILSLLDEWKRLDLDSMPCSTSVERGQKAQAIERKRAGYQWNALLLLARQTGFGATDLKDLRWSSLSLTGPLPCVDHPRMKTAWKTGAGTPRVIPLLPDTISALKEWRSYEPTISPLVFRSKQGGAYVTTKLSSFFSSLASKVDGSSWSLKHLRNVPGSIARKRDIQEWQVQALLGHTPSTLAGKRYTEDCEPSLLLPLVNAIGEVYSYRA